MTLTATASPPLHDAALTATQAHVSLLGATALCLIFAFFLRRRAAGITSSIERRGLVRRSNGAVKTVRHSRTVLEWAAFLLFAAAGVCASGTFVGSLVLWFARQVQHLFDLLPVKGQLGVNAGLLIVGLFFLHKGLHLLGDVLEGKAHQGGADWLAFLGPMVFTLVPGYFGEGAAWVYSGMATHIVPLVEHL